MNLKNLKPHEERVVEELEQLSEKSKKLSLFIMGDIFKTLDNEEKKDLVNQLEIMENYADVLERRIERFKK